MIVLKMRKVLQSNLFSIRFDKKLCGFINIEEQCGYDDVGDEGKLVFFPFFPFKFMSVKRHLSPSVL